jgi:hypothetical protein
MREKDNGLKTPEPGSREYWLSYWEKLSEKRSIFDEVCVIFSDDGVLPSDCDKLVESIKGMFDVYEEGVESVRSNLMGERERVNPFIMLSNFRFGSQMSKELTTDVNKIRLICTDGGYLLQRYMTIIRKKIGRIDETNDNIFEDLDKLTPVS